MLATNGIGKLREARTMAADAGALATAATLDLQLAASSLMAFDPAACRQATAQAQEAARRWNLRSVLATALLYEARAHALDGDRLAMEQAIAEASSLGPPEPLRESSIWVARATLLLLRDDLDGAVAGFDEALAWERRITRPPGLGPNRSPRCS